ncbi:MAG: YybH family protein [Dongiaceae bacterium]
MTKFGTMILASALMAGIAAPVSAESPRDEIEAALFTFAEAFNQGDAAAVAAHYTEDAAVFPPEAARVDGRAGIQTFWKGAMDSGLADLTLKAVEVHGSDELAFEVGEVSFSTPDGSGGRSASTGKYIVVWKKDGDGGWRLYRDIWNANPAAAQ